jgi:hypothetical protein
VHHASLLGRFTLANGEQQKRKNILIFNLHVKVSEEELHLPDAHT